ncbi:DnaB-like helicase C-terminal domain-containing protein [Luteolibacter luteus]|uniref:DNA 5'-3' helicase n=1 Tax=Luteolibacter luteus TaxID=2728835 RepID=A0A858RQD2_9BACT|nr:DnaB-like helicase C-terminal domain-containing protein [Luteolibacter luteus]QJE99102.1 AAA family ATPase [Luteolibacter luteus]
MLPLPHALGPEKSVLSSLMKSPDLLAEHSLDPQIFHVPAHRILYQRMKGLEEVELISFIEGLRVAGLLENIGGPAAITDIYTYAPSSSHFESHLGLLRDRHARRVAIAACAAAVEAANDCADDGAFLRALGGPITNVFDIATAATPPKDTKALAREFLETFEAKVAGRLLPMGLATGIPEIDRALRGLHPQHMGVISARSGGGKSTMATQIAANLATDGIGVLYLILERTEQSAFQRSVIQTARIHHAAVIDPAGYAAAQGHAKPDHATLLAIRDAITKLVDANFHIRKPPNRRLSTQCAEIRRYVRLHGVKVVFVDQIGLIRGERQRGDTEEVERRGVSNTLQELAHELGITVVVLSQVTDEIDTKGARAIEEDADWWLHIAQERDKKKPDFGEHQHVLIAKDSHNGMAGERLPLVLDHATLRFVHGAPKEKEEVMKGRGVFAMGKAR